MTGWQTVGVVVLALIGLAFFYAIVGIIVMMTWGERAVVAGAVVFAVVTMTAVNLATGDLP